MFKCCVCLISLSIGIFLLLTSCKDLNTISSKSKVEPREIRTDHMYLQRAFPRGNVKETALQEAKVWKEKNLKSDKFSERSFNNIASLVGPTNAGGRVVDVEIPFDQPDTYYIAAASGGIFKTEDGGATWVSIFDDQGILTMGDISISKNNTNLIWVGTGEADAVYAHSGNGVYKSIDGGDTWESKGLSDVGTVGKILLDPNDDNTIFVAAMGPVYRNSENKGIYRSKDGGNTWTKVLYINDVTGGIDISMHPSNSNIIYASMWQREFTKDDHVYGGPNSGIYRSVDGGNTWEELTNELSTSNTISKIKLEIAPSNPNVVYALYINAAGNIDGFYASHDEGNNWKQGNTSFMVDAGFNEYFGDIYVDPTDENVLYNMGFWVYKSTNGGQSWTQIFDGVHADQQSFAFNPINPNQIIIGNDGGVYKSDDDGSTFEKINNLPITQFYRLHVNVNSNNIIYGGSQDNGSWRSVTTDIIDNWEKINNGDGMQPLANSIDDSYWFTSTQGGQLFRGGTLGSASGFIEITPTKGEDKRSNWDTPVAFDPSDAETLYYGSNHLHKSSDAGNSWKLISPDLSNGPGSGSSIFGTMTTIDVSTLDNDLIYAGLDDGNIWVTENGGTDWTKISDDLPVRWVTKVYADRENSDKVYVTFSGYRYGEDNGNIYVSEDRGQNWTALGATLPDIPINDVVTDNEGNIIVGTDAGLFISTNQGESWETFGINLPSVIVTDLQIADDNNTLYLATYGRSMYKIDISSEITNTEETLSHEPNFTIVPNPARDNTLITLPKTAQQISVIVYNSFGEVVIQNSYGSTQSFKLSLVNLASGTYFLQVRTASVRSVQKLIVM